MKRKFTFFGICVLICTLMISLGSCQKDYSEDIADLQAQITANQNAITALNSAIASGKLIKTVATTSTGYTITFSDNTTISLNHGTNGTPGAPGATGPAGATGFTPIIGIDADGYWTVVTTQGGTPARILVGGQPVFAKFTTDQFGANAQGFITINGVATSVYVPIIVYNDVTKKIQVTIKNTDGTFTTYNVAVDEDTFLKSDLVSVVSPIGMTKIILSFGYVPANAAGSYPLVNPVTPTLAGSNTALAYAGVTWDQLLRSQGNIPVIINPAQAVLTGYTFEIIKQNGTPYAIQPGAIVEGYAGAFSQFAAAPSNGLYTLPLNPTKAAAVAASTAAAYPVGYPGAVAGESYELAVRATKGGREVHSGYQYAIKVQQDVNTVYTYKAGLTATVAPDPFFATIPWKVYVPIGTTKNLLDYYALTALQTDATATTATTLTSGHFYKSSVSIIPAPGNVDVENFVSVSNTSVTTTQTSATVTNLNNKTIPFKLTTFDWRGMYWDNQKNISVVFYSALNNTLSAIPFGPQVLTTAASPADQKVVVLTQMFTELDAVGKTELWRTNADNVKVVFYNSAGTVVTPAAMGVSYQFKDANDNPILGLNATATVLADVQAIRKIEYTFDETVAVPGNYTAKLEFTDRRAYAAGSEFKLSMPFTISNPDLTATLNALKERKPNLFSGDALSVYGTYPSALYPTATAQTDATNAYYDLYNAYVNLYNPPVAPTATWKFTVVAPLPVAPAPANPLIAGLGAVAANTDRFIVSNNTMYTATPYNVRLTYYYFGNLANSVVLDNITVAARSEVRDGMVLANTNAKPAGWVLPANLQVTNGDLVTQVPLSFYVKAQDYLGFNLKAFGRDAANAIVAAVDTRIDIANVSAAGVASVKVLNTSANAHLVSVVAGHPGAAAGVIATAAIPANPLDFTISATNAVAIITNDVVVPLTVEITDIFGKKLTGTINVTVKKP
ncbi:MAG: hypothetical protein CVU12_08210 [Bacteroidetes bacterium HGW-Bacteroidetes-7]|nr:MAG: hypothetical protein CVU12_08210 [Bacteroidetes bacterium HGW-Bacteroidetes-7]